MSLGSRVRDFRLRKEWSMRRLARHAGTSHVTISRIEGSRRQQPGPTILQSIAAALEVPVDHLLRDSYRNPRVATVLPIPRYEDLDTMIRAAVSARRAQVFQAFIDARVKSYIKLLNEPCGFLPESTGNS